MTRLAIAGNAAFALDERETRRAGPTYTLDTLEALHREGHERLVLILGSDALADMPNWHEPARTRRAGADRGRGQRDGGAGCRRARAGGGAPGGAGARGHAAAHGDLNGHP